MELDRNDWEKLKGARHLFEKDKRIVAVEKFTCPVKCFSYFTGVRLRRNFRVAACPVRCHSYLIGVSAAKIVLIRVHSWLIFLRLFSANRPCQIQSKSNFKTVILSP